MCIIFNHVLLYTHSLPEWDVLMFVVNSFFVSFTQSTFSLNFIFQNISLEGVCTDWLNLSRHKCTSCFPECLQTSVIGRTVPYSPIFRQRCVEIVRASFLFH